MLPTSRASVPLWGTVENLTWSGLQPATRSLDPAPDRELKFPLQGEARSTQDRVFITFGGPQGHDDKLSTCGPIVNRLICGVWLSPRRLAGRSVTFPTRVDLDRSETCPTADLVPYGRSSSERPFPNDA